MSAASSELKLLVAGDRPLYVAALTSYMGHQPRFTECLAVSLDDLVYAFKEAEPDVVLVQTRDFGRAVVDALELAIGICDGINIVLVFDEVAASAVEEALHLGVCGCVSSAAEPGVMIDAVTTASRGGFSLGPRVVEALRRERRGDADGLRTEDLRLLTLVAEGLDNSQVASALNVSDSTLRRMTGRIISRLGVANRTQAAVHAVRRGLI
jgi:DNA-binding NarL/FixJ family response regulator